jgi:ABC-type oligopeptide transport system substrate-binding subunit
MRLTSKVGQAGSILALLVAAFFISGCASSAGSRYFGKTQAPTDNVLRYVSGSEPESLDPHISSGQPEVRIYMALLDGLVEYYLMEQLPSIPVTISATNWMKKPYVKGLYPSPGTLHPWKFVYIERDPARWDASVDNIMRDADAAVEEQLKNLEMTQIQNAAKN